MVLYIRYLLNELLFVSDNIEDLKSTLEHFKNHLEGLYEMELYYGDETMKSLLDHSKSVRDFIERFNDIYSLTEEEETGEEFENEEEDSENSRET
jgi:hypothetical protein